MILSGGHVGCLELFAHAPIRSVRDLKGRSVAVGALGDTRHIFLAMVMAYIGLDPRKDVTVVVHPPREAMRLFEEKKVDAYTAVRGEDDAQHRRRRGILSPGHHASGVTVAVDMQVAAVQTA